MHAGSTGGCSFLTERLWRSHRRCPCHSGWRVRHIVAHPYRHERCRSTC